MLYFISLVILSGIVIFNVIFSYWQLVVSQEKQLHNINNFFTSERVTGANLVVGFRSSWLYTSMLGA